MQLYYERCLSFYSNLKQTEIEIAGSTSKPTGKIRISAPAEHAATSGIITKYLSMYPEVKVEVTFTDKTINIVEEGYDISIHIGL